MSVESSYLSWDESALLLWYRSVSEDEKRRIHALMSLIGENDPWVFALVRKARKCDESKRRTVHRQALEYAGRVMAARAVKRPEGESG